MKNYHISKDLQWIVEIMTGVGGIFTNYEDNLVDKKKISECFSGNFHEILYSLN